MILLLALALMGCSSARKYVEPKNACEEWREDVEVIYNSNRPTYGPPPMILCPGDEIKI